MPDIPHGEYTLTGKTTWIHVKGFEIFICATADGVTVDIFDPNTFLNGPLASTQALDHQLAPKDFT